MRGLLSGLIAVIVPILVFLAIPGASMFLFYIPIWLGVAVVVLGIGLIAGGERGLFAGSLVLGAIAAFSFLAPIADLNSNCWTFPKEPKRQVSRPARIILDSVAKGFNVGEGRHHPAERVAVLTGAEIVQFSRDRQGVTGEVKVLQSFAQDACATGGGRTTIKTNGPVDHRIDRCLKDYRIKVPEGAASLQLNLPPKEPALELVGSVGGGCMVVRVYETAGGSRSLIARFIQSGTVPLQPRLEELFARRDEPRDDPIGDILWAMLAEDTSEKALFPHLK